MRTEHWWERKAFCLPSALRDALSRFWLSLRAILRVRLPHCRRLPEAAPTGYRQVFVRDTCIGAVNCTPKTTRISLQPDDGTGVASKPAGPALSSNANHV